MTQKTIHLQVPSYTTAKRYLPIWMIVLAALIPQPLVAQLVPSDSIKTQIDQALLEKDHRNALATYCSQHPDNDMTSEAIGTVQQGQLKNGKLIPFSGDNFVYYDTLSYLDDRAYVHHKVKAVILDAYDLLAIQIPDRTYTIMECSKAKGGKIWPHRTHQNGMSVDFMVPMMRDGHADYTIDSMGFTHYLLDFEQDGSMVDYPGLKIDFEAMALHLLALQQLAKQNGLKIQKILLRESLHDDLFACASGKLLKAKGLYFPTKMEPLIDQIHDNHYHIDFQLL